MSMNFANPANAVGYDPTTTIYTDPLAASQKDPVNDLTKQLSDLAAGSTAPKTAIDPAAPAAPAAQAAQAAQAVKTAETAPPTTTPAATAATPPPTPVAPANGPEGGPASADSQALLGRLAPLGIKSLDELKTKSMDQLRKLSSDVVQYEQRRQSLDQFFFKNPDGSYDFSKGTDGSPTGLDATGRVAPVSTGAGAGDATTTTSTTDTGAGAAAPAAAAPPAAPAAPSAAAIKAKELAAIKARAIAAGLHPNAAGILATYNRNQARKKTNVVTVPVKKK